MSDYLNTMISAIFTGIGTGIGSYLATKYAITHLERAKEKLQQQVNK